MNINREYVVFSVHIAFRQLEIEDNIGIIYRNACLFFLCVPVFCSRNRSLPNAMREWTTLPAMPLLLVATLRCLTAKHQINSMK